jgi:hypothetical protein
VKLYQVIGVATLGVFWSLSTFSDGVATGPPRHLLELQVLEELSDSPAAQSILALAEIYLGKAPTSYRVGTAALNDPDPLGESYENLWFAEVRSVDVSDQESGIQAQLTITLILRSTDGRLLAAYTNPRQDWVLVPPDSSLMMTLTELHSSKLRTAGPLQNSHLASTIPEILGYLWKRRGIDPSQTGQIVMRPREVMDQWPAYPSEDGRHLIPNKLPHPYWILQVEGAVVKGVHGYNTRAVFWMSDEPLGGLPHYMSSHSGPG